MTQVGLSRSKGLGAAFSKRAGLGLELGGFEGFRGFEDFWV